MKSTLIYRTKNISRRGAKRKEEERERERRRARGRGENLSTFRRGIAHYRDAFYYRFELIDSNYIPGIIALRWTGRDYCRSKEATMISVPANRDNAAFGSTLIRDSRERKKKKEK